MVEAWGREAHDKEYKGLSPLIRYNVVPIRSNVKQLTYMTIAAGLKIAFTDNLQDTKFGTSPHFSQASISRKLWVYEIQSPHTLCSRLAVKTTVSLASEQSHIGDCRLLLEVLGDITAMPKFCIVFPMEVKERHQFIPPLVFLRTKVEAREEEINHVPPHPFAQTLTTEILVCSKFYW